MLRKNFFIALGLVLLLSGAALAQGLILKATSEKGLDDPYLYVSLGDFLMKKGYEEHALSAYAKALELDSGNKEALNNLGFYYKDLNPLMAEDYFRKAIDSDRGYLTARNNLALLYNKMQRYDLAAEELEELVSLDPRNINYNYDLAVNLANKYYYQTRGYEDLDMAISYFKTVYAMDSGFGHAFENIKVLEEIRAMYN